MKKTILLRSRYGDIHKLERIGGKESHLFLFIPADDYYRIGLSDNEEEGYDFVDPSGGPFIQVGMKIDSLNKHVKFIGNKGGKIVIEFE